MRPNRTVWLHRAWLCCGLLAAAAGVHAAARIDEIRFAGNDTTRPQTMLQEMTIRVGDPVDRVQIERSRQAVMNLGIFKDVRSEVLREGERHIVQMTVVEKRYLLPLPRLNRNADGDISYGAQIRWDNFRGLNQTIKFTYEETRPAETNASEKQNVSAEFHYPRAWESLYGFNVNVEQNEQTVEAVNEGYPGVYYHKTGQLASVSVSRLLKPMGPTQGWSVNTGLAWSDTVYDNIAPIPTSVLSDTTDVNWGAGAGYADVRDYLYSRAGAEYGYNLRVSAPTLGADRFYYTHAVYFRSYNLITERPHVSLDYQVKVGLSSGLDDAYALGSSDSLRGYKRDSIKGNAFVLTNVEYQQPLFGRKTIRGVIFTDIGNAYPSNNEIDLFDVKASIGVGLRYNVTAFVKVQLRIDYGYAISSGDNKTYAGTKETF